MHVLEPKDRGRRLEDHFRPLDGGILGKGHYGEVCLVERISDGQRFALKTINTDHPVSSRWWTSSSACQLFLVFELCHGGELFEPIADSSVTCPRARARMRFSRRCATSHDIGVSTGPGQAENILLKERGIDSEIKLIDFALAIHESPARCSAAT
ncbi:hypothetical protein FNF27_08350 [Cafeteria roenbergensis]|uniref:Protein kinase domain-containing protein n=1 Tax=Cafeteria roenbergensis TaxID=33653 RepID=A0A5A8D362_CAFRO|nr:hypothetical protein FNF27_08350 [Cafeteria roenbergensis]